jgi:hypothetical protein
MLIAGACTDLSRFDVGTSEEPPRIVSPLLRTCPKFEVITLKIIAGGVRLHVMPDDAPAIAERLRSHQAYARTHALRHDGECPAAIAETEIKLSADADAIDVTSANPVIADAIVRLALDAYGR